MKTILYALIGAGANAMSMHYPCAPLDSLVCPYTDGRECNIVCRSDGCPGLEQGIGTQRRDLRPEGQCGRLPCPKPEELVCHVAGGCHIMCHDGCPILEPAGGALPEDKRPPGTCGRKVDCPLLDFSQHGGRSKCDIACHDHCPIAVPGSGYDRRKAGTCERPLQAEGTDNHTHSRTTESWSASSPDEIYSGDHAVHSHEFVPVPPAGVTSSSYHPQDCGRSEGCKPAYSESSSSPQQLQPIPYKDTTSEFPGDSDSVVGPAASVLAVPPCDHPDGCVNSSAPKHSFHHHTEHHTFHDTYNDSPTVPEHHHYHEHGIPTHDTNGNYSTVPEEHHHHYHEHEMTTPHPVCHEEGCLLDTDQQPLPSPVTIVEDPCPSGSCGLERYTKCTDGLCVEFCGEFPCAVVEGKTEPPEQAEPEIVTGPAEPVPQPIPQPPQPQPVSPQLMPIPPSPIPAPPLMPFPPRPFPFAPRPMPFPPRPMMPIPPPGPAASKCPPPNYCSGPFGRACDEVCVNGCIRYVLPIGEIGTPPRRAIGCGLGARAAAGAAAAADEAAAASSA